MVTKAKFVVALLAGMAGAVTPTLAAERDFRHTTNAAGDQRFTARYLNLDGNPLSIAFTLPRLTVWESSDEFGYSRDETWRMARRCNCGQREYDSLVEDYYRSRLLTWDRVAGRRILRVDVPAVVKRNGPRLRPVAREFERLGSARGYRTDETVDAIVTFVQTALKYHSLPHQEGGREILGFYQPLRALQAGVGDCDSKAALLASILMNIKGTRMIGVHVAKHYVLAIARVPKPGDAFIQYRGQRFVLIEPSGPMALPPGRITRKTKLAVDQRDDLRIDPLY